MGHYKLLKSLEEFLYEVIVLLGFAWYVRQQAHWFATKRGTGMLRGWTTAASPFLLGLTVIIAVALLAARAS